MFNRDAKSRPWYIPYVGGGIAGVTDCLIFHMPDTALKRIQNATKPLSLSVSPYSLRQIIFNGLPANASVLTHAKSLCAGMHWALLYKVVARGYKFGCQPSVEKIIRDENHALLQRHVDRRLVEPLITAMSAGLIGMGEFFFAPLDAIVVRYQGVENRSAVHVLREEGIQLYKGCNWTATRNFVGSFFLFSIPAVLNAWMVDTLGKQHPWQEAFTNTIGGIIACIATNPFDVVKTRVQMASGQVPGADVFKGIIRTEGVKGLMKGLPLRMFLVVPRLAISKTVAEGTPKVFDQYSTYAAVPPSSPRLFTAATVTSDKTQTQELPTAVPTNIPLSRIK